MYPVELATKHKFFAYVILIVMSWCGSTTLFVLQWVTSAIQQILKNGFTQKKKKTLKSGTIEQQNYNN